MSLSEEMDEAAEKEGQAEKNRKQAEENRQRIEALEEALENQVEEILEKKVEELKGDLEEELGQMVEEALNKALNEALGEALKPIREDLKKVNQEQGAVREMQEAIQETLSEGVPLKGKKEFRQLREKIGKFMKRARTMTELMSMEEKAQRRVTKALKNVRERGKEARKEMRAKTRLVESSAKALDGAWWKVAVPTALTVAVAFLGVIAWGTVETIPQTWRTTEEEQADIREMRRLERAVGAMTDKQLEQYRTLLQKAEKQARESSGPQD